MLDSGEPIQKALTDKQLTKYWRGWGQPSDLGIVAVREVDGVPVSCAWVRALPEADAGLRRRRRARARVRHHRRRTRPRHRPPSAHAIDRAVSLARRRHLTQRPHRQPCRAPLPSPGLRNDRRNREPRRHDVALHVAAIPVAPSRSLSLGLGLLAGKARAIRRVARTATPKALTPHDVTRDHQQKLSLGSQMCAFHLFFDLWAKTVGVDVHAPVPADTLHVRERLL